MRNWFFDFDETITLRHTIGLRQSSIINDENLAELRKNLRNAEFLAGFLEDVVLEVKEYSLPPSKPIKN